MNTDITKKTNTGTKKIIGVISVAVLGGAIFVGGSYWAGISAEQQFHDNAKQFSQLGPMLSDQLSAQLGTELKLDTKMTVIEYKRGIFGATARTEFVLGPSEGGEDSVTVPFNHDIRHGPILSFGSMAHVRSELVLPEKVIADLVEKFGKDPFDGKAPLTVESTFSFLGGGGADVRIISPKVEFEAEDTRISWGGLDGKITANSDISKFKSDLVMNDLSITKTDPDRPSRQEQFQMERLTLKFDTEKPKGFQKLFVGTSSLAAKKLSFQGPDTANEIRSFVLENAYIKTDTKLKSEEITINSKLGADTYTFSTDGKSKTTIDKPEVTFLFENLDASALDKVMQAAQGQDEYALSSTVKQHLGDFLKRKPVFAIKNLRAGTPEGVTKGDFSIAYTGNGDPEKLSPTNLAVDLEVDLKFSFPADLVSRLGGEDGAAALLVLGSQGILVEKKGILGLEASYKKGVLTLNGKETSLEDLKRKF
ncbi:MAG: YdgA family protein [Azoarcus sp.]|nr:YdgA family protein [Azoarcus sp.]